MDWDKLLEEATRYLQEYIRIQTVNPPGNEIEGANFLKKIFEKDSIPYQIFEPSPGRGSILATLKGGRSIPSQVSSKMGISMAVERLMISLWESLR